MIFSLEVIRAKKGDCLLLHYGTDEDPHHILIDGGPAGVYRPFLKPRLKKIKENRGFAGNEPLPIELLMVSHVDDDHIHGILDMTRDLIQDDTHFVEIREFWHNSFENILDNQTDKVTSAFKKQFGTASLDNPPSEFDMDSEEDDEIVNSSLKVLASIKQGAQLRSDIERLEVEINPEFDGDLIIADGTTPEPIDMGDGLMFTVIGPMKPELDALRIKHQEWLRELSIQGKSPEDVLSAYVDKSVPNLASLVVLVEFEGKTILLTGDARGDKILEGLQKFGYFDKSGSMHVDILKVPHHGSANNLDDDFFERITADHYVFSGNGEHGNPERETLEMVLGSRGNADYNLYFTYPLEEIDAERKLEWEKQQKKEKEKKEKKPNQIVRANWSEAINNLQNLFSDTQNLIKVIDNQDMSTDINLLNQINF